MVPEIISFITASKDQLEPFYKQVETCRGVMHARVHNFWLDDSDYKTIPHTLEFAKKRDRYLQECLKRGKVPVLFFEDKYGQRELHKRIGVDPKIPLYVVTTRVGDPGLENEAEDFPELIKRLKDAKVRRVLMGGQYLVFHPLRYCQDGIDDDMQRVKVAKIFSQLLQESPNQALLWAFRENGAYGTVACLPYGCVGFAGLKLLPYFDLSFSLATSWPAQVMTPKRYDDMVFRVNYLSDNK